MEELGVESKYLEPSSARRFSEVSGSYTYFADGDVLLAKITPCFENGKLGIARGLTNGVGFGSSEYIVFRPGPELYAEYLYYFLNRASFREEGAQRMAGAVGHKRVSLDFIESYKLPLPPLLEQRRIVAVLDEAFEAIATAKANTERNLENARSVEDSAREDLFLRHIGERVPGQTLSALCELIVDCEHKTAPTQEEGVPSIRTPNIGKGRLLLNGVNRVSEATYIEWTRRAQPRPGDLIFAREAPAGNVAVIPPGERVCLGQRTVLIRPKREHLLPEFLVQVLLCQSSQDRLLAHSRGATVQHVNLKDIRAFDLPALPSHEVQRLLVDQLEDVGQSAEKLIDLTAKRLTALDELKQSLLHQAFTGALTSKSTDQQLQAVA